MPRSPWLASLGCTKKAGVPVEAKVAAILRPTWPDLPMPVTITRPRARWIRSTAAANERPSPSWIAAMSAVMPAASASKVRTADAINSRALSLVGLAALSGFDLAMMSGIGSGAGRGGSVRNPATADYRNEVNGSLTISVLTPLTRGRSTRGPLLVRRRRQDGGYRYKCLISNSILGARGAGDKVWARAAESGGFPTCRAVADHRSHSRSPPARWWRPMRA